MSTPPPDQAGHAAPPIHRPVEDVSFVDLAVILVRWGVLVLVVFAAAVAWSAWTASQTPKRYESRAMIKIGRSRISAERKPIREERDRLLEPADVLAIRLREEYRPGNETGAPYAGAYLAAASFDKDADELLTLTARAGSPEAAQLFLKQVVGLLIARHSRLYAAERAVMEGRQAVLAVRTAALGDELQVAPPATTDPTAAAMHAMARATLTAQRLELEQEAARLELDLAQLQTQPTELITPPTVSPVAVEPRTKFMIAIGAVLGLIAGCAAAWASEFAWRVRRRLQ